MTGDSGTAVTACLQLTGRTGVVQPVVGIGADYVEVDYPRALDVCLPIGSLAALELRGKGVRLPLDARIVWRKDGERTSRYRFRASGDQDLALAFLPNQRAAYRVKPNARDPIEVEIAFDDQQPGPTAVATLQDVSGKGLGMLVRSEDELELYQRCTLHLGFRLHGDTQVFRCVGHVRQRSLSGSAVHYGLEFDPRLTIGFEGQEQRIHRYVMRRQQELIRRARVLD